MSALVVTVSAPVGGSRGPHPALLLGMLPSGRVRLHVMVAGRTYRVITEPANITISRDAMGVAYQSERTA